MLCFRPNPRNSFPLQNQLLHPNSCLADDLVSRRSPRCHTSGHYIHCPPTARRGDWNHPCRYVLKILLLLMQLISASGVLLDRGGIFVASLVILVMGILFGIFGILRSYASQLMAIGLLVFLRPLMYTFGTPLAVDFSLSH
jgi:hypothetical protein